MIEKVGNYCKNFRVEILKISQTDFCNELNVNVKSVSAFEGGRANNIKYLYYYYEMCLSDKMRSDFINGLFALSEVSKWQ